MPVSVRRCPALGAAAAALVAARVWLRFAPGHAVRWGSRIGEPARGSHECMGRGSHGWLTGRGSHVAHGSFTGRGSRGSQSALFSSFPSTNWRDPHSPGPVENPRDPRPVENLHDARDPRPVESPRARLADARIRDLSRAVIAVAARPPWSATCLEQSLALVMLLSIARIPAHVVVGVARVESTVRAHAWVECCGDVVLGGAQAEGLTPLLRAPATSFSPAASSCPG